MIKIEELNKENFPTSPEIDSNLLILLERLNIIRTDWGKPMTVTSGLRSQAKQDDLITAGKSNAPHSKHLIGAAADIYDPELELTAWLKENDSQRLVDAQLWCEAGNANWCHFQIYPPNSGNRWFIP